VAVSFGYGDNTGTNWIRCSLFGKRAEGKLPQHLVTGQKVAISGELKVREYDDREGVKKTSVEVNVNSLDLMGNRQEGSGQQSQSSNKSSDTFKDSPPSGDFPDDDIPF
jgi:single-strand DNA-binding protein